MITIFTGLPRNGKTLYAVEQIEKLRIESGRPVFYHNIYDCKLDWSELVNPQDWNDLPIGAIIVFDEAQDAFPSASSSAAVPPYISELSKHGHHGYDMFFITQHPMFLHPYVRRNANRHYHVVRFFGFDKATIHEFQKVRDNPDKDLKGSIEHHYIYNKDFYGKYKSAELHTVKKRIPMRLILMIILPILFFVLLYYGYQVVSGLSDTEHLKTVEKDSQQKQVDVQLKGVNTVPLVYDYVAMHQPLLADFPQSAPIYNEVTKPITAPYAAACIASKRVCKCYTQQATPLNISDGACRQIASGGLFIDFDTTPDRQQSEILQTENGGLLRGEKPLDGGFKPSQASNDVSPREIALNLH